MKKRNFYKVAGIFCIIAFTVGIIGLLSLHGCKKEPEVYKIGAILPLTGPASQIGTEEKQGADLAVSEINNSGGINGKELKIIYEDSKADPKEAVNIFIKFVNVDKLPVIMTALSGVSMASAAISDRTNTVMVASCTHPEIANTSKFVFRIYPNSNTGAKRMAEFCFNELKISKIAVLYINDESGLAGKKEFRAKFEELGGTILIEESFEKRQRDFKSTVIKLLELNPPSIYIHGYSPSVGIAVKQIREMGLKSVLLSFMSFGYPEVIAAAGKTIEGAFEVGPPFDPSDQDENVKKFVAAYRTSYKQEPTFDAAYQYDIVKIIVRVLSKAKANPQKIQKELLEVKDFPGVSGEIAILENGDSELPMAIRIIKDGKSIPYKTQ